MFPKRKKEEAFPLGLFGVRTCKWNAAAMLHAH